MEIRDKDLQQPDQRKETALKKAAQHDV